MWAFFETKIGFSNWTKESLDKAWNFNLDYDELLIADNPSISSPKVTYTGFAYYDSGKKMYKIGTAIFSYKQDKKRQKTVYSTKLSLILLMASVKISSLVAYESLMQFGFPKASPVTVATLASDKRYIEKSSALLMVFPRKVLPK